ncbi:MAG: HAD family hydrolase [Candidatus Thorarchaeota archaeon]
MIRNIIFDLGNVLLNFKPQKFLLKYIPDEEYVKEFTIKVIGSNIWLDLDRGTISIKNAEKEFLKIFPKESTFIIWFFKRWMEMLTPIHKNIKILYDLKTNGYKTYILSNYIIEAFNFVSKKYDFFSLFNGDIISSNVKMIKPEIEIYQKLIDKYNLVPEESVFIEDVPRFLLPARKLKIKTILFSENTDLRSALRKLEINI